MNHQIFKFLKNYSTKPFDVDRLIISAFLSINKLFVHKNLLLKKYYIKEDEEEFDKLILFCDIISKEITNFNIEDLIELFEFVVSPSDRIINGAIYTPLVIRDYIVKQAFDAKDDNLEDITVADISCGCSGFLLTAAKELKRLTKKSFSEIFKSHIFGLDIQNYSIIRSKLLLSLLALSNGEEEVEFDFNLFQGNALTFKWESHYPEFSGFSIIIGNPPYVTSRNMEPETLKLLENWDVCKSGHPDLYIPFFKLGIENLSKNGILGYITVNSFLKSINGRSLRSYFEEKSINLKIIDFGGEQIFKDRNTYTCICFITNTNPGIQYLKTKPDQISKIKDASFLFQTYNELDHKLGWNITDNIDLNLFIRSVESIGRPFNKVYKTKNGIATLKNNSYKFKPISEDERYFYLRFDKQEFPIEKSICRDIINANKIKCETDLEDQIEKIIFPYVSDTDGKRIILPEDKFIQDFPKAYQYLLTQKAILSKRDKGNKEYETWYAYGRKQSMESYPYKLFFPHICLKPNFVLSQNENLLFYNGIAAISDNLEELQILKIILESKTFLKYIQNTSKHYASGYISMARNYLKSFGIPDLTDEARNVLLNHPNPDTILENIYNLG